MLNDLKRVGVNGIVYLFTAVFSKGLNILLMPIYAKYLTVEEYGGLSLLLMFKSILVSILGLGQIVTIKKTYYNCKRTNQDFKKFLGTIFLGTFFLDIILLVIVCIFGQLIFDLFFEGLTFWWTGFLVLLSVVFFIPYQNLLKLYQSRNETLKFSFLEIALMVLDSLISLLLIIQCSFGVLGKSYGIFISMVVVFLCCIPLMRKEISFNFDMDIFKKNLLVGLPIIPHSMANLVLNLSDRMFLNKVGGLETVGIYSLAYQVGQIIDIIALSFIEAWSTFFMKNAEDSKKQDLIAKFALYFLVCTGAIVLFLTLYSKELILIFFDDEYYEAYLIIPIVAFSYLVKTIYYVTNQQMIIKDRTNLLLFSTGIASIINLILNYVLIIILDFGMYGAAFATLISIFIMSAISYKNGQDAYPIKYDKLRVILIVVIVMIGMILNYIYVYFSIDGLILKTGTWVLLVLLMLAIIPKKDLVALRKVIKK